MNPYKFVPYLKSVIWGGDEIASLKGIDTAQQHIGESWELSGVPGHESVCAERGIANDEDKGLTLHQLIQKHGARLMGDSVMERFGGQFPLLVKIIDARQDLSVQVHPDDKLALERHNSPGKTEMWYIIETQPGAKIHVGLKHPITPSDNDDEWVRDIVENMDSYESHAGDCFFLPAGRLHAIGAGNLLAEIQQTSDITYRVYDYDRVDADGHPRELHVKQARAAVDYTVLPDYRTAYDRSLPSVELVQCPYFVVHREMVEGTATIDYHCDSFVIVVCLSGEAIVNGIKAHQGETLLVPACANTLSVQGNAALLTAFIG